MEMQKNPLVSCLCITNNRLFFLKRAINCFKNQTYEDSELLIVCLDTDLATINYMKDQHPGEKNIQLITISSELNLTLGDIRNESIKAAKGEFFCVWDDDDYYHCERLSRSMHAIKVSGKSGVVLGNLIIHHLAGKSFYISVTRLWEQTLLFNKQKLLDINAWYASLNKGEDTALIKSIIKELYFLKDPTLYIYTFHASNTCDASHLHAHLKVGERLGDIQETILHHLVSDCNEKLAAKILDSRDFMEDFPLATQADLLPWGVKPFCTYPNPRRTGIEVRICP
ncbi:MAG TPA: glycosyltransferase family A protein [Cellvibrio sp.]|nr:glycosyltransferase family A protein [Cellvibrio sp.]